MAKAPKDHQQDHQQDHEATQEQVSTSQEHDHTSAGPDGKIGITIQGIIFHSTAPYQEGHPLTAIEASALNGLRAENLRNNFSNQVKKAYEAQEKAEVDAGYQPEQISKELFPETVAKLHTTFSEYDSAYKFSVKGTRTPVDPIEAQALSIAKQLVLDALRQNNIKASSLPEGRVAALAKELLGANPQIMEEAKNRIAATKALAASTLNFNLAAAA